MSLRLFLLLSCASVTTYAPAVFAADDTTLAVLPIGGKVPPAQQKALEEALVAALGQAFEVTVLVPDAVRERLSPPKRRALARCKRPACYTTFATTLGAGFMLSVQARAKKAVLHLSLALLNGLGKSVARSTHRLPVEQISSEALAPALEPFTSSLPAQSAPPPADAAAAADGPATAGTSASTDADAEANNDNDAPDAPPTATPADPPPAPPATQPVPPPTRRVRGWLGVRYHSVDAEQARAAGLTSVTGVYVTTVLPGGPAAAAGLSPGDIITEVSGTPISAQDVMMARLAAAYAGDTLELVIVRAGAGSRIEVTLGERPVSP